MEYFTLNTGARMPKLGLGMGYNMFAEPESFKDELLKSVEYALELGYRHIDTAFIYMTEDIVGAAVNNKIKSGLICREDVFITTKVWPTFSRRPEVVAALKRSLETLGMDYVDMFLIHWPLAAKTYDLSEYDTTDYMETWLGMEDCFHLGLTKAIGLSNFNSKQITRVIENGSVKPAYVQIECHPYLSNEKLVHFCQRSDIVVTAYSPLVGAIVMRDDVNRPSVFKDPVLNGIGAKYDKTAAQVSLRYLLQRNLAIIPKSKNGERLKENMEIFDFQLSDNDMALINSRNINCRIVDMCPDHPHYPFNEDF